MSYELRSSVFNHPDQKSGQHTNGPANLFVREDDSCPWYQVLYPMPRYKVKKTIEQIGLSKFFNRHCARLVD